MNAVFALTGPCGVLKYSQSGSDGFAKVVQRGYACLNGTQRSEGSAASGGWSMVYVFNGVGWVNPSVILYVFKHVQIEQDRRSDQP